MIPSEEEALALHRKYGSRDVTIRHCRVVAQAARILAEGIQNSGNPVDVPLVVSGALLHDIGRSRTQTVGHGEAGAEILRESGVDERVCQIVQKHVGAGISADEVKRIGLPDLDYLPRALEERIVCFADKMVGSDRIRPFQEEVDRFVRKGHNVNRLMALKSGLEKDLGADPETLILDNVKESQTAGAT